MAKPKHGRWNNCANSATKDLPSSSSSHPNHLPCHHDTHQPPRRSSTRSPSPSPAVLSALAIIATTTPVVAGGPLPIQTAPPSFLCPFIERDNIDPTSVLTTPSRIAGQAASTPTPTTSQYSKREPIADKYVKGSDNLWRKTDGWILYGSTCCSSSTSTSNIQSVPTTSSSSSTSMPTTTPTAVEFDTSTLPAGWDHPPSSGNESTIILALAIVLAGSICVFMLGCVIWRKRKKRSTDTERKVSHKLRDDGVSEDDEREKDARGKMRLWAKTSARWKSSIHHSARRRRKKTIASKGANLPQSPTPYDSREVLAGIPSVVSRRSSFTSQEPPASRPETSSSRNSNTTALPEASFSPTLPSRSPSPPTYGPPIAPRPSRIPPSVAGDSSAVISCGSSHPSENCSHPSAEEDEPLPYLPPSDGHVATDDKARLARIHELASSPRNMPNDPGASTMLSAPAWHEVEDDLGDLGLHLEEMPTSTYTLGPPLFPPPPIEANIPLGYLYGDPFHYGEEGDVQVSVPIPAPSAPSFEVSPSAPPIGDLDLEPSAPSLEDQDDVYEDWDDLPVVPASAPAESAGSSHPSTLPRTRGSASRDSALPRYQP